MPDAAAAEWILKLVTTPERAASTVGDLLEETEEKPVWFWGGVVRIALSYVRQDLVVYWPRMVWLAFSGFLEAWILATAFGMIWIPFWMAVWPHNVGPNAVYVPPWTFYAMIFAMLTAIPFLTGWDVARRSRGRELAATVALTCVSGIVFVCHVLRSGVLARRFENPYPYERNSLTWFCASVLCMMAGAILFRIRANANARPAAGSRKPA